MAYDYRAAVCKSWHYTTNMTVWGSACLVTGSYVLSFLDTFMHVRNMLTFFSCRSNVTDHFLCSGFSLLAFSCSDNYRSVMVLFVLVGFDVLFANWVLSISYFFIVIIILKMNSSERHQKAFSTWFPTSLQSPYFMGWASSYTYSPAPAISWTQTKWPLCSTPWPSPC